MVYGSLGDPSGACSWQRGCRNEGDLLVRAWMAAENQSNKTWNRKGSLCPQLTALLALHFFFSLSSPLSISSPTSLNASRNHCPHPVCRMAQPPCPFHSIHHSPSQYAPMPPPLTRPQAKPPAVPFPPASCKGP